jgi:hypothetical protein
MKKIRGDKPVGIVIHIYREISQGNSLCSYLRKLKCCSICFIFSSFVFYKIRKQESRTGPSRGRADTSGRGKVLR